MLRTLRRFRRALYGLVILVALLTIGAQGTVELTPEMVVAVVAVAISLALDVVPGLKERWEALPKEVKRFSWLLGCVVVAAGAWLMSCVFDVSHYVIVVCTSEGLMEALRIGLLAYYASQATHGLYVATGKVVADRSGAQSGSL